MSKAEEEPTMEDASPSDEEDDPYVTLHHKGLCHNHPLSAIRDESNNHKRINEENHMRITANS